MADRALWTAFEAEMQDFVPIVHADLGLDDSIEAMARRAVADAPQSFVLVGFSMGGYVAREIARSAPERVRALVLIATSSRADTPEQARRKAAAAKMLQQPFKGLSKSSIAASVHPSRTGDSELVSRIRDMGIRLGRDVFLRQAGLIRTSDFDRLGEIRCPTLIVAGEQDSIRSLDEAIELKTGIQNSKLEVVRAAGHMIPMEQPSAVASLIKAWLHCTLKNP